MINCVDPTGSMVLLVRTKCPAWAPREMGEGEGRGADWWPEGGRLSKAAATRESTTSHGHTGKFIVSIAFVLTY